MAKIGFSYPVLAEYSNNNGTVTYSNAHVIDHGIEFEFTPDTGTDNNLYGDNMIVESDAGRFNSGTLMLNTTDLQGATALWLLGAKTVERTIGTGSSTTVSEIVFDDGMAPKQVAFGGIVKHMVGGAIKWQPVIYCRMKPQIPADAATTQEDEIDWQTPETEFTVLRSEQVDANYDHPWKFTPVEWFDTEAEAKAYIDAILPASA